MTEKALLLESYLNELRKQPEVFQEMVNSGVITVDTWDKITNIFDMTIENIADMIENEKTID